MKRTIAAAALAAALMCGTAYAQQITAKIGVLTDMSSLYADATGPGSVAAAKMAAADFMKDHPNVKVELVSADHQNKADVGSQIANQWYDVDKVDVIADVPNSGVALAITQVAANKNKIFLGSGPASSDLTGPKCNMNNVHWTYDTWMLANGTGKAMVKTGGDTWFFLTSDYAFGHALERDTAAVVEANGGKVLGKVRHPINTNDFSSFLLQAQASKAKVIGLANAGGDTINSIKQASEFGIVKGGQKLAGLLVFVADVNALGLQTAQGADADRDLLLGPERSDPRLDQALASGTWRDGQVPDHEPRGRLREHPALSQGPRGTRRRTRRQDRHRQNEGDADRRSAVRQGHDPRRRPQAASGLSVRSEEAGGVEVSRRLLSSARHHSGERGLPSAQGWQLSAGERVTRHHRAAARRAASPGDPEKVGVVPS